VKGRLDEKRTRRGRTRRREEERGGEEL